MKKFMAGSRFDLIGVLLIYALHISIIIGAYFFIDGTAVKNAKYYVMAFVFCVLVVVIIATLLDKETWNYIVITHDEIILKRHFRKIRSYNLEEIQIGYTIVQAREHSNVPCLIIERFDNPIEKYLELEYMEFYHKELFKNDMLIMLNKSRWNLLSSAIKRKIRLPIAINYAQMPEKVKCFYNLVMLHNKTL